MVGSYVNIRISSWIVFPKKSTYILLLPPPHRTLQPAGRILRRQRIHPRNQNRPGGSLHQDPTRKTLHRPRSQLSTGTPPNRVRRPWPLNNSRWSLITCEAVSRDGPRPITERRSWRGCTSRSSGCSWRAC